MFKSILLYTSIALAAHPVETELIAAAKALIRLPFDVKNRLLMSLKGCKSDGIKVGVTETFLPSDVYRDITEETLVQEGLPTYLDYMTRVLHVAVDADPKRAAGDSAARVAHSVSSSWQVTPLERFLTAIGSIQQLKIVTNGHTRYPRLGEASGEKVGIMVDALASARGLTEELIFTFKTDKRAFAMLSGVASTEGEAFCRLAFSLERFAFRVANYDYDTPTYVNTIVRATRDYLRSTDNPLPLLAMLPWIDNDRRVHVAPNRLSTLMRAVWNYRQESPVYLGIPEHLLIDFLAKARRMLRVERSEEAKKDMQDSFACLLPALRDLANEPGNINESPEWYGRDFWDLTPHPEEAFAGLPMDDLSDKLADLAVSIKSFRSILLMYKRTDLVQLSQFEVLSSLMTDTRGSALLEALVNAPDLEVDTLLSLSPLFDADLVAALDSIDGKYSAQVARIKFFISTGSYVSAVNELRRLSSSIGWGAVARVIYHLGCSECAVVKESGAEFFEDKDKLLAFQEFAHSLAVLRRSHPAEKLEDFVFPGFADIALFVAAGEEVLAFDRLHVLKRKGGWDWKPVEDLVKDYCLFGKHLPLVRRIFPSLIANRNMLEAMLHAGQGYGAVREFVWLVEKPQIVGSFRRYNGDETMEDDVSEFMPDFSGVTVSPADSDKIALMAMHVLEKWRMFLTRSDEPNVWARPIEMTPDGLVPVLAGRMSFWLYLLFNSDRALNIQQLIEQCLEEAPENLRYFALVCCGLSYHRRSFRTKTPSLLTTEVEEFVRDYRRSDEAMLLPPARPVVTGIAAAVPDKATPDSVAQLQTSLVKLSFADV